MVTEKSYVNSEEDIFNDDEYGNLPHHKQPLFTSESRRHKEEEEELENGIWQIINNRNGCVGLPFTHLKTELEPQTLHAITHPLNCSKYL